MAQIYNMFRERVPSYWLRALSQLEKLTSLRKNTQTKFHMKSYYIAYYFDKEELVSYLLE